MIKENQRFLNRLHILSDGVLVFLSMLAAHWMRFSLFDGVGGLPMRYYLWLGAGAAALYLVSFGAAGLYRSHRAVRFFKEASSALLVSALDVLILTAVLFALHLDNMSRWLLGFFYLVSSALLLGKRMCLRVLLHRFRAKGYNLKHVVLVGSGPAAKRYLSKIRAQKNLGYQVDGVVSDCGAWGGLSLLGEYAALEEILTRRKPDEVVLAIPAEDNARVPELISVCEKTGTKASIIPFYAAYLPSNPQIDDLDGLALINLRRIPLDNLGNAFLKRAEDILGSLVLILLTSPLMLIAAVGVKLSSPGPILFCQERVGRDKKVFRMYKFRSMRVNAKQQTGWSTDTDPRKTRFGALIRKCSIDELPQLFNVLRGDMSLVGPRPEVPFYVEQFKEEIPRYMVKHQVRPGITGWAQVCGFRGDTSIEKRIEHDLYYIENWNLLFDVKILLMTVFKAVNSEKLK